MGVLGGWEVGLEQEIPLSGGKWGPAPPGGRTDESPEQPSSPPLAQLPTASIGPGLPQGLAFPGGVVRGAGLEEAGWGPGWVAELCLSTLAGPAATAGPLLFQQRRLP